MNRSQLIKRRSDLVNVHCWCFENEMILSELQLICVSQEIASIMRVLDSLKMDSESHVNPEYKIPKNLEYKAQVVLDKIKQTNWERGEYIYDEVEKKYIRKNY